MNLKQIIKALILCLKYVSNTTCWSRWVSPLKKVTFHLRSHERFSSRDWTKNNIHKFKKGGPSWFLWEDPLDLSYTTSRAPTESTFLFLYIIILQRGDSFDPPSSTLTEDRHMRSWTFLYEIQFRTTFIWSFFWCNAYFWQQRALKWISFPIFVQMKKYCCYSTEASDVTTIDQLGSLACLHQSEQTLFSIHLAVM